MYKLTRQGILRNTDGATIPVDPGNRDYTEYLIWVNAGNTPEPIDTPSLDEIKAALFEKVDSHIANIYTKFQRFQMEYTQREAAAQTYKNAGYTGTASPWIDSFANAAGLSINAATDLILQQAAQLRGALAQLGALRMQKYSIRSAVSEAAANAVAEQIIADANVIAAQL